jgi:hypothetical protein
MAGLELPPTFNPERDVLVWAGPPGPALPRGTRVFRVPLPSETDDFASGEAGGRLVRSGEELYRAVFTLAGPDPRHVLVHRAPGAAPDLIQELVQSLKSGLASRSMARRTVAEHGATWLAQGLANLPAIAVSPSIAALAGAFAGRPALLASPGPSLSHHLARLPELRERALLVSGTHALSALVRAGAPPHLVVGADPGDLVRHWQGLDLGTVGALVVAATCRPATLAAPVRRRFVFGGNGSIDAWLFEPLGEEAVLEGGGSVACSMLALALHLGCDPLVLVGQDLSFTDRFYAAENLDGDARVEPCAPGAPEFRLIKPAGSQGIGLPLPDGRLQFVPAQKTLEVPGWSGGRVRTTPQLKAFLDWFENVAPALAGSTRLVNATEGGAHIRGFEHVSLAEVSAAWKAPVEVEPVLERATAGLGVRARRARLATWAGRTLATLEECTRLARNCGRLADSGALTDLARAEKKLSRALKDAPLVSLVAQDDIVRAREVGRTARTVAENLAAARTLYGIVERAGTLLAEPLRQARQALD